MYFLRVLEITPSKSNNTWGRLLNQLFCFEFWGYLYFYEFFWVWRQNNAILLAFKRLTMDLQTLPFYTLETSP